MRVAIPTETDCFYEAYNILLYIRKVCTASKMVVTTASFQDNLNTKVRVPL